ncbi:oligopeptide transport system permease protein [Anaerovibrio lipolyticus DSM 3074]|uniref:Oligopeptide transport system permease protein n=1 Tax=Anaerovibrio lipolyticus DSM 3074 TaxID=1120997 RepID=A0A1M6D6A0_9FIRM|nr:ABC transporter permease [Anaerovibrio lipolyticus]SHI68663.1 oligopeptide transport system permease protein [Anaerovibrio lipolyticus DSM 3074]
MLNYLGKRLLNSIIVLWIVMTVTFLLMHAIPGGPFTAEKNLPPAVQANIEARYKLNDPLTAQYMDYVENILHGDLGPSFKYVGRSVNDIIGESFPVSFELGMEAILISLLLGIPAGVLAAYRRNNWQDRTVNLLTTIGIAVPGFVLAALMVEIFAMKLGLLPAAMWIDWKSRILPAFALAAMPMAFITRLTRSSMLEVLGQDYIKTAKAKGLGTTYILFKHALPNALIPVVTYVGPMVASILTGSFVIETIFAIPGLGSYFVTSIYNRDYTVILGVTIFYSAIIILMNMLVDIIYPMLDPRINIGAKED